MGRRSLGEVDAFLPAFGMKKITVVSLHAFRTPSSVRLALASLTYGLMMDSPALCKKAGQISSGPGDFYGLVKL